MLKSDIGINIFNLLQPGKKSNGWWYKGTQNYLYKFLNKKWTQEDFIIYILTRRQPTIHRVDKIYNIIQVLSSLSIDEVTLLWQWKFYELIKYNEMKPLIFHQDIAVQTWSEIRKVQRLSQHFQNTSNLKQLSPRFSIRSKQSAQIPWTWASPIAQWRKIQISKQAF